MTTETTIPDPPEGLGPSGQALWRAVLTDYELDEHESATLRQACRLADACDRLQAVVDEEGVLSESAQGTRAHPALVELRQQGLALARLVSALRIPAGESDGRGQTRPGIRGVYGLGVAK